MSTTIIQVSKMDNNYKFNKWFSETWGKTGGLISYSAAADILGCSRSYISKLVNEKKLTKYQYLYTKNKYISRNEILEFKSKINYEKESSQETSDIYIEIAKGAGVSENKLLTSFTKESINEFRHKDKLERQAILKEMKNEKSFMRKAKLFCKYVMNKSKTTKQNADKMLKKISIEEYNEQIKDNTSDLVDKDKVKI
jgi:hypothetical protein